MIGLLLVAQLAQAPARNVVVVISDGVRAREIFEGADRALMTGAGGVENEEGCRAKFWRDDVALRRQTLTPFLWNEIAAKGQLFGSSKLNAGMRVTNPHRISYPGYNELLTGFADPRISSNSAPDNPNVTVFEWLESRPGFHGSTQAFATWETFVRIFNVRRSGLDVRAGWNPPFENDPQRSEGKDLIDALHRTTTPLFGGNAFDAMTFAGLKESLRTKHPRVLFLGLGETDEWMHAGRYDLALESLQRADRTIAELWATLQSLEDYRGTTALLVTTDHGRGLTAWNWRHHGPTVSGADEIWLGAMGAGIPALGVRSNTGVVTQSQVAATIAALLGEDPRAFSRLAAPPLPLHLDAVAQSH
jgi:hypothetical protein